MSGAYIPEDFIHEYMEWLSSLKYIRRKKKKTLTPRACLVLKYLLEHIGESFSYRELTEIMPWSSKSTTFKHVNRLKALNLIEEDTSKEGSIRVDILGVLRFLRGANNDRVNPSSSNLIRKSG